MTQFSCIFTTILTFLCSINMEQRRNQSHPHFSVVLVCCVWLWCLWWTAQFSLTPSTNTVAYLVIIIIISRSNTRAVWNSAELLREREQRWHLVFASCLFIHIYILRRCLLSRECSSAYHACWCAFRICRCDYRYNCKMWVVEVNVCTEMHDI